MGAADLAAPMPWHYIARALRAFFALRGAFAFFAVFFAVLRTALRFVAVFFVAFLAAFFTLRAMMCFLVLRVALGLVGVVLFDSPRMGFAPTWFSKSCCENKRVIFHMHFNALHFALRDFAASLEN